jgi:hypothetical protein
MDEPRFNLAELQRTCGRDRSDLGTDRIGRPAQREGTADSSRPRASLGDSSQGESRHRTRPLLTAKEPRVVILRAFSKKTQKEPTGEIDPALQRAKELKP